MTNGRQAIKATAQTIVGSGKKRQKKAHPRRQTMNTPVGNVQPGSHTTRKKRARTVVLEESGAPSPSPLPPTIDLTTAAPPPAKRTRLESPQHEQPSLQSYPSSSVPSTKRRRRNRPKAEPVAEPADVIVVDDDENEDKSNDLDSAESAASTDPEKAATSTKTSTATDRATTATMEQLESEDFFEILGLPRSATDADVKKAYRKLAIQWHPDKNREHPKAEEYFKKIAEAYEVLSDPEKRRVYEVSGKAGLNGSGDADGFGGGGGFYGMDGRHGRHYHHHGFSARHARDIFEAFFGGMDPFEELFGGGHGRRQSRPRGPFGDMDDGVGGFAGFGMPMMMGFGGRRSGGMGFGGMGFGSGGMMMDSFFGDDFGAFGGGFSSQSVSSSSFTDRNGHVVTKKTITTVNPDGRTETVTEEYRNGKLVTSTTSGSNSRLAGAGRMQLDSGAPKGDGEPPRLTSSSSRQRSRRF